MSILLLSGLLIHILDHPREIMTLSKANNHPQNRNFRAWRHPNFRSPLITTGLSFPQFTMHQPSQPPPQYSTLPPAAAAAAAPPPQQQPDPLQQPTMQQPATMAMMPAMTAGSAQRRRISARHTLFKVAFSGLLLAVVLFIVGFSAPGWANKSGLWMSCSYRCFSNVGRGSGTE